MARIRQRQKRISLVLALWCFTTLGAVGVSAREMSALRGRIGRSRRGRNRMRRRLKGFDKRARTKDTTKAGRTVGDNIFLRQGNRKEGSEDRFNIADGRRPDRAVSPFELGAKGYGYLLGGHEQEISMTQDPDKNAQEKREPEVENVPLDYDPAEGAGGDEYEYWETELPLEYDSTTGVGGDEHWGTEVENVPLDYDPLGGGGPNGEDPFRDWEPEVEKVPLDYDPAEGAGAGGDEYEYWETELPLEYDSTTGVGGDEHWGTEVENIPLDYDPLGGGGPNGEDPFGDWEPEVEKVPMVFNEDHNKDWDDQKVAKEGAPTRGENQYEDEIDQQFVNQYRTNGLDEEWAPEIEEWAPEAEWNPGFDASEEQPIEKNAGIKGVSKAQKGDSGAERTASSQGGQAKKVGSKASQGDVADDRGSSQGGQAKKVGSKARQGDGSEDRGSSQGGQAKKVGSKARQGDGSEDRGSSRGDQAKKSGAKAYSGVDVAEDRIGSTQAGQAKQAGAKAIEGEVPEDRIGSFQSAPAIEGLDAGALEGDGPQDRGGSWSNGPAIHQGIDGGATYTYTRAQPRRRGPDTDARRSYNANEETQGRRSPASRAGYGNPGLNAESEPEWRGPGSSTEYGDYGYLSETKPTEIGPALAQWAGYENQGFDGRGRGPFLDGFEEQATPMGSTSESKTGSAFGGRQSGNELVDPAEATTARGGPAVSNAADTTGSEVYSPKGRGPQSRNSKGQRNRNGENAKTTKPKGKTKAGIAEKTDIADSFEEVEGEQQATLAEPFEMVEGEKEATLAEPFQMVEQQPLPPQPVTSKEEVVFLNFQTPEPAPGPPATTPKEKSKKGAKGESKKGRTGRGPTSGKKTGGKASGKDSKGGKTKEGTKQTEKKGRTVDNAEAKKGNPPAPPGKESSKGGKTKESDGKGDKTKILSKGRTVDKEDAKAKPPVKQTKASRTAFPEGFPMKPEPKWGDGQFQLRRGKKGVKGNKKNGSSQGGQFPGTGRNGAGENGIVRKGPRPTTEQPEQPAFGELQTVPPWEEPVGRSYARGRTKPKAFIYPPKKEKAAAPGERIRVAKKLMKGGGRKRR